MILWWYYTRRVWFFWYELDSASMFEISWLVCALMLTWWRSLTSWVVNSAVGWGGEIRPEPIDWIVIGGIMTRALKDQWISISIASMSLIGLFWLELAVWWFPSSRGHHTTCHDGTKIHAYCGVSVVSLASSLPWWASSSNVWLPSWKKSMLMSMHPLLSSIKSVDIKPIKLNLLLLIIFLLASNQGSLLFALMLWVLGMLLLLLTSNGWSCLIDALIKLYS